MTDRQADVSIIVENPWVFVLTQGVDIDILFLGGLYVSSIASYCILALLTETKSSIADFT
jgi:hypothetical protein